MGNSGFTFAWLIEWPAHASYPAQWWHPEQKWVRDAFQALKFSSEWDAKLYIRNHVTNIHAIATEHGFEGEDVFQRSALQPKEVPDYEAVAREICLITGAFSVREKITTYYKVDEVVSTLRKHFPQQ